MRLTIVLLTWMSCFVIDCVHGGGAQLALLADGAVVARQGDTVVMVSAVSDRREMDTTGFLPLSVEYREKVRYRTSFFFFLISPLVY